MAVANQIGLEFGENKKDEGNISLFMETFQSSPLPFDLGL